jgi:hypothetical protein
MVLVLGVYLMEERKYVKIDGTLEENIIGLKQFLGLRPDQDFSELEDDDEDDDDDYPWY